MNQPTTITTAKHFSFKARGLPEQLLAHIQPRTSGYWQHQFDRLSGESQTFVWNLGIVDGRILYSGNRTWSVETLVRVVQRYVPRANQYSVKLQLERLKQITRDAKLTPAQLLAQMQQLEIVTDAQLQQALRTKVLSDLDIYLLMGSGEARFVEDSTLAVRLPIAGFEPIALMTDAKLRQQQWSQTRKQIPSMSLLPKIEPTGMSAAQLPLQQKQRLEKLLQPGKNLAEIATEMAKDTLEIAQMFAKLVDLGAISFQTPQKSVSATILAIDDSQIALAQFEHLVKALGHPVATCQDAEIALATIERIRPAAIFIDINMPVISGFELVKQIRQQPELAKTPLVILTGEQKLSNKWRAQWSGCEFLTKPLTTDSLDDFRVQIEELLPRLLGANAVSSTANNSQN